MALEQETQNSVDLLTLSEYVLRRLYKNVNNGTKLSERERSILNIYELILNDGIVTVNWLTDNCHNYRVFPKS